MSKQEMARPLEEESKIIDTEDYSLKESEEFQSLLAKRETTSGPGSINLLTPGQILPGTIVEVTKDFVVVDVGLKSEGLIPIGEFGNDDINLGEDVEVYLDETES